MIGYRRVPPKEAVSTACVLAARNGRVQLAFSPEMLEEVMDVLQRAPFSLTPRTARLNVRLLERGARLVKVTHALDILQHDPDDNAILETAVVARADYLVTWNRDHFRELGAADRDEIHYRGVTVVSPGVLLRALRHEGR